jgi:hypothetical protein
MAEPFYTIGHSTHSFGDFVDLLQGAGVTVVTDVRTVPRSRANPQYNRDVLPEALAAFEIGYAHISSLGGLRRRTRDVPPDANAFWQNESFHIRGLRDGRKLSPRVDDIAGPRTHAALRRHVRRSRVVAVPPANHRGLPDRRRRAGVPHSWPRPYREGRSDQRRAAWPAGKFGLSGGSFTR